MGNHAAVGHSLNILGCTDVVGFENSAKAVINLNAIEPWNAMDLVRDNLRKQAELARRTPLRKIAVEEGLPFIKQRVVHNGTRPRLCCEPTRASNTSIDKDFDAHPGKNTLPRQDAHEMPAVDLEACMKRCRERGDGAFVVWRGKAYFKSQSEVACRQGLFNDRDAVAYLNMIPKSEDFDVHEGMNCMAGKDAHSAPAGDLAGCKQLCRDKGYGAFVVCRGTAYFKSQSHLACREGLKPDREATAYLNLAPLGTWRGWMKGQGELGKEEFTKICSELLDAKGVHCSAQDRAELGEVFDSIDFDRSGTLSVGEWAGGLSVFFKGSPDSSVHAVFKALDRDNNKKLTKAELQEYLKPLVKAMSPPSADSLRPLLLKKATDDIYREMDLDSANDISSDEMLQWTKKDNSVVDRLAGIIDKEVYKIWLDNKQAKARQARPVPPPAAAAPGGDAKAEGGPNAAQRSVAVAPPGNPPAPTQQSLAVETAPQGRGAQQGHHWWESSQQAAARGGQPQGSGGAHWGGEQQGASGQGGLPPPGGGAPGGASGGHGRHHDLADVPPPPPPPQRKVPPASEGHYGPAPPGR